MMDKVETMRKVSSFITSYKPSVEDAYRMGKDCARNGPNEQNCHLRIFCSPEHTKAWERGKAEQENMTDRLQQKAEELTRIGAAGISFPDKYSSELVRSTPAYEFMLAGLTAGIAMAAEREAEVTAKLEAVVIYWRGILRDDEQKRWRSDKLEIPTAAEMVKTQVLGNCTDVVDSILRAALAKGEPQNG